MRLKLLSYNIHKGFSFSNRHFVLERIRRALRQTDADILFLQEVIGHQDKKHLSSTEVGLQFEYLADSVWPHLAYGQNAIYSGGHHGNAILSKFSITSWENQILSSGPGEMRGMLRATVSVPSLPVDLVLANAHFGLSQKGRDQETEMVIDALSDCPGAPFILVGDFNDWNCRVSPRIEKRLAATEAFRSQNGYYSKTFPSFFPLFSLDRVFLHRMACVKARVLYDAPWKSLSDHLPLYVEAEVEVA